MCGLVGFVTGLSNRDEADEVSMLNTMVNKLHHRGPDASGVWLDSDLSVGLGHSRLAIQDVSNSGAQPMMSVGDRYVIVFNGEIYNFKEIKLELEEIVADRQWRGHSDTEVLLAAITQWGVDETLKKLNGMFAFALWDKVKASLILARDRFGEKPLYYGSQNGAFLFGSELKALKEHPSWLGEVDREALKLYMRHAYIPAPYSIFKGIKKLLPAHYIEYVDGNLGKPVCYWSLEEAVSLGMANPYEGSFDDAVNDLDTLLRDSIKLRMLSDVPLGAFLSGGIDSSVVVSLMQTQSTKPVQTFSIGFDIPGYNEAVHAKAVAQHIGTDHTELYVTAKEALEVIPKLASMYDEPFGDSSQIPTYMVSKMAREHVTVSLSGDGGDEIFGGYTRYFQSQRLWNKLSRLPLWSRKVLRVSMEAIPPRFWNQIFKPFKSLLPGELAVMSIGDRIHKLAGVVDVASLEELYVRLISICQNSDQLVLGCQEPQTIMTDSTKWPVVNSHVESMMYLDTVGYLPGDILTKVDRASMAVSLESRIPLLDHRLVEFAWRLPLSMKVRDGVGKTVLREVLYKYVPKDLIERPKQGFGIPLEEMLRGPLRSWAENLLKEEKLKQQGYLNPDLVSELWSEHLSRKKNRYHQLWTILMFQAWLEEQ